MNSRYVLAVGLSLGLLAGYGQPAAQAESPPVAVQVHVVTAADVAVMHTTSASVHALERAELATRVVGRITQLYVREGDTMRAGQLLARIDADDLSAALAQARAGLAQARASHDLADIEARRAEDLHAQQALPAQARDRAVSARRQAQASVDAAQQAVDGARAMLSYTELRAPFDGVVAQRLTDVGDLAAPGVPLVVVERTDSVRVVASIPESAAGDLRKGDAVQIDCGNTRVNGSVHSVVAAQDQRRLLRLQVLAPAHRQLQAGRFARLTYQVGSRQVIWMPQEAQIRRGQLQGTYVASGGRALLRWVRPGAQLIQDGAQGIEVVAGLSPGDRVIIAGTGLYDGAPIVED